MKSISVALSNSNSKKKTDAFMERWNCQLIDAHAEMEVKFFLCYLKEFENLILRNILIKNFFFFLISWLFFLKIKKTFVLFQINFILKKNMVLCWFGGDVTVQKATNLNYLEEFKIWILHEILPYNKKYFCNILVCLLVIEILVLLQTDLIF